MRTKRVKVAAAALVASVFMATGCSASDPSPEGDGPIEVSFWANQFPDSMDGWLHASTDAFNESQDEIFVNMETIPWEGFAEKLKAAQAAGQAPDIRTVNYSAIPGGAARSELQSLSPYIDEEAFADLYPNIREFVTVGDDVYGFPMWVEPSTMLFYRKDMFEAAGLDPEVPPTTWDELIEYGEALTGDGVFGFSTAQTSGDLVWSTWGLQMNTAGEFPISDDWSESNMDNPAFADLIAYYQELRTSGIIPDQALAPYSDIKPLLEGQVAMIQSGSFAVGQIRNDYPEMEENVGIAIMPTIDGDTSKPSATLGGWNLVLDGRSEKQEAVGEYIQWMLGEDPQRMSELFVATKFSQFTARQSVDEILMSAPEAEGDAWRSLIANEIVPISIGEPAYPFEISEFIALAMEKAMQGESVDAVVAEAHQKINDFIAENDLAGTNPQN